MALFEAMKLGRPVMCMRASRTEMGRSGATVSTTSPSFSTPTFRSFHDGMYRSTGSVNKNAPFS
jgi:hypothetical protein